MFVEELPVDTFNQVIISLFYFPYAIFAKTLSLWMSRIFDFFQAALAECLTFSSVYVSDRKKTKSFMAVGIPDNEHPMSRSSHAAFSRVLKKKEKKHVQCVL